MTPEPTAEQIEAAISLCQDQDPSHHNGLPCSLCRYIALFLAQRDAEHEREKAELRKELSEVRAYVKRANETLGITLRAMVRSTQAKLKEAEARLPEGMKNCVIHLKKCVKGHGWLTANNWVQHDCPTCRAEVAEAQNAELRAQIAEAVKPWREAVREADADGYGIKVCRKLTSLLSAPSPAPADAKGKEGA